MKFISNILVAGIIWTGAKLTPIEGANILLPNSFAYREIGNGPTIVVIDTTIDWPRDSTYNQVWRYRYGFSHSITTVSDPYVYGHATKVGLRSNLVYKDFRSNRYRKGTK